MGLIRPMGLMGLMLLMSLMGLVGCSSDDDEFLGETSQGAIIPEVASYVTWYEEARQSNKGNRAWAVPTGYMAYEDGIKPIGIAFTQDTKAPMIGSFFYSSGKWRTSFDDIKAETYYLYGYIPHLPGIRYSITDYNGGATAGEKNADYSTGAIMTLENVPTVMPNDLCVVIGAKDGTGKETVDGLRRGAFAYAAKATSSGEDARGNYVFLLFDHLYASLRVKMKVFDTYAALRTIKLKSLQMSTKAGDTTSKDHNTITVKLLANDGSASPITGAITYEQTGATIGTGGEEGIEFWKSESAAGQTLTTAFQDFTGHFMPSGITTLILTSVYDVYDTKGNKIRENCKATNTMVVKDLLTEQTVTQRGKKYTVNMTINPTYLYVLSEPDLDNPTVTID